MDSISIWVPFDLWDILTAALPDETSDIRRMSSWQVERTFLYLDISDFSTYTPGQQALVINYLNRIVNQRYLWRGSAGQEVFHSFDTCLCIGDGYIYVFQDAMRAAYFAAYLGELIECLVARRRRLGLESSLIEFHFRMGLHKGMVYTFWDPGRNSWNYIGDGINGGNRVLSVIEKSYDDVIYVSDQIRDDLMARPHIENQDFRMILDCLVNRGRREDKHRRGWRVHELNQGRLCGEIVRVALGN